MEARRSIIPANGGTRRRPAGVDQRGDFGLLHSCAMRVDSDGGAALRKTVAVVPPSSLTALRTLHVHPQGLRRLTPIKNRQRRRWLWRSPAELLAANYDRRHFR